MGLKWLAEQPSQKWRDPSSLGVWGQVSAGMDRLQVNGQERDIFGWVILINGATGTFQMLFGEGKLGLKWNWQPMDI